MGNCFEYPSAWRPAHLWGDYHKFCLYITTTLPNDEETSVDAVVLLLDGAAGIVVVTVVVAVSLLGAAV